LIYEYRCPICGHEQEELLALARRNSYVKCERCARKTERKLSVPAVIIPAWMSDANIESNKKNREWLKTPEAKKMDLSRARGD
jgi:putative FmdB family regulatory protein